MPDNILQYDRSTTLSRNISNHPRLALHASAWRSSDDCRPGILVRLDTFGTSCSTNRVGFIDIHRISITVTYCNYEWMIWKCLQDSEIAPAELHHTSAKGRAGPRALDSLFLVALKRTSPCSMPWQLWESQSWFSPFFTCKMFEIQKNSTCWIIFDIQNKMW